jgi:diguanylate cyclase (GGDEF)-like protein
LLSPRGETLATTLTPPPAASERRIREDGEAILQSLSSGTPPPRVVEHPGGEYLVEYDRIRDADGRTVAALSVAVPRTDLNALEDQLRRWFAILGSVVFLLVIVVGSLMTAKITVPVERLGKVTAEISRGNLQCEVPIGGADEVGDLTRAFSTMTTELRGRIQQLHELNRGMQALNETLDPAAIVTASAEALQRASGADGVVLVRRDPNRETLQVLGGIDRGSAIRPFTLPITGGVASGVLLGTEPLTLSGLRRDDRFRRAHPEEQRLMKPYGSLLGLPLIAGGETRGAALLMWREDELESRARSKEFLGTLASQVTIALENARLYQLAVRDPLSGLHVHSYFAGRLKEEIDRALRSKRPLSVIRLDVPGLARLRDGAGPEHAAETLRDVARTIRAALRRMCVAARNGDASFEILLPETEKREAMRVAERLRRQVDARLASDDGPRGPRDVAPPACAAATVSFPDDGTSLEFLLNAAELALEESKAAIRSAPESPRDPEHRPSLSLGRAGDPARRSEKTLAMLETAERIAQSAVTVLIQGETGVGKEILAERIHRSSPRRDRPLVKVNCSAFPETLLESELFGHEKGAFTGADQRKIGRFEQADGGTLFLDEIGELSPSIQVKLLRVIQDRSFERLGSSTSITVDVRIIAATNKNLVRAIQTGAFREDLYYRLNVAPMVVPPLRDRKEEIPGLVDEFIRRWNAAVPVDSSAKRIERIAPEALDLLFHHSWPGNVRELKNAIERALVVSTGSEIRPQDLQVGEIETFTSDRKATAHGPEAASALSQPSSNRPSSSREEAAPLEQAGLNPRQKELLSILELEGNRSGITTAEYVTRLQVSERTGLRDLADLVRRQILSRDGRTKGAVYRLRQPERRA